MMDQNLSVSKYFPQFASWKGAYSVEILDVNDDGYFDAFVAGHEDDNMDDKQLFFCLATRGTSFPESSKS